MKKTLGITLLAPLIAASSISLSQAQNLPNITNKTSMSSSEAKCAIWLCLPVGFGAGCSQPRSEFKKAIRKGRNPLPSWGSCRDNRAAPSPQPYTMSHRYITYVDYGYGKIRELRGRGNFGLVSSQGCPQNGIYTTEKKRKGDYIETWATSICTTTDQYTTTFNDYVHIESEWGQPLDYTLSRTFKPYVISRKRVYDH